MRKFFSSLFLFFISATAFADNIDVNAATHDPAVANHTDLSLTYLGQVFGSVGNVLHGATGQMLGKLFFRLNEGIVVVAGLYLTYTIFTIVLRSAQEGSFMGQNKNVALVFLKIAFGFALLIPNASTGYSLLQDITMKVVVEGVGLADSTWRYGLQYVQNGGSVWHRPEDDGAAQGQIVDKSTAQSVLGSAAKVFADEVCMYTASDSQPTSKTQAPTDYEVITNDAKQQYEFPGEGGSSTACGYLSWKIPGNTGASQSVVSKQAAGEFVNNLLPAAKRYYCSLNANKASCVGYETMGFRSENVEGFFGALMNYVNAILPLAHMNQANAMTQNKFITQAENEGWMMAGRYYWDLSRVQAHYDSVSSLSSYVPADISVPDPGTALGEGNGYAPDVQSTLGKYRAAQSAGNFDQHSDANFNVGNINIQPPGDYHGIFQKLGAWFINAMSKYVLLPVIALMNNLMDLHNNLTGWDPILFLHKLGMSSIATAGDLWLGMLTGIAAMSLLGAACSAFIDLEAVAQALLSWVKPLVAVLATSLWAAGFVLAFYVPMYPYIIFTFGVIGWIIAAIEAMVAAPLVCFGLTHPEGHDFLGEAKQAFMLLFGVFLRPVLMVIGLIAGMILSYVSLRILMYTYSGFISDLFYVSAPNTGGSPEFVGAMTSFVNNTMQTTSTSGMNKVWMVVFIFPLTFIVFVALVYVVTTQCFSLIFKLPYEILRWIGVQPQSSMSAQMAQQVQGVMSTAGEQSGRGAQGGTDAMGETAKEISPSAKAKAARGLGMGGGG